MHVTTTEPPDDPPRSEPTPKSSSGRRGAFHVGGALGMNALTYVRRSADDELLGALRERKYCLVLNSRQMGKSSLRVQATKVLRAEGTRVEMIDVSVLQELGEREWYWAFIGLLAGELGVMDSPEFEALDAARAGLAGPELLTRFVDQVVFAQVTENLVVFIEEIDSTLNVRFKTSGFFATLRQFHEKRPLDPRYKNLTFVLVGVARPSDFAEDDRTTPFNVARAIDLTGFTLEQLRPLRAELPPKLQEDVVLRRVLYWTGGQPLLTHKLCAHLAGHSDPIPSDATGLSQLVDTVTRERVISGWENAEDPEHLQTIRERFDRLLERDQTLTTKMLNLYAKVLAAEDGLEVGRTREELELRLTGLVVARDDRLRSTNQIYREVFGPEWLKRQLKRLRPYHEAFEAWKRSKREDTSRLLEGQALKEGLTWSEERSIGEDERAFLRASQARVDARRRRFQRITLVVAGALLLAFVVSVALYFRLEEQTRQARENYDRANSERDRANAEKERASLEKDRANVERERASQEAAQRRVEADSARAGWAEAQRQQGIATAEKEKAIEETKNARDAEAKANYQSKLAFENAKQRDEEAKRAREAEAVAVKNTARIQAQYDSLASSLAECTTLEGQLTRARAEVDRLRKQCSPGESGVRAPSGR